MAARCTRMDASVLLARRSRVPYRSACLLLGALCLLAALAGTAAHAGPVQHHRAHALAAAAIGYDLPGVGHRSGADAAPATRAGSGQAQPRLAAVVGAAPEPRHLALGPTRTRGPPATA